MTSLRNIGILAHVDAGKTTTTEQILFRSGRIRSLGRVDDGTAHTDWLDVEKARGISVKSAVTRFTWNHHVVNLIDTPGHVDFSAEVERALFALDGAILVVSAAEGVQPHTETLWHALSAMHLPTLIYVNKVDRTGASLADVLRDLRTTLHPNIVPIQVPLGYGPDFSGCIDIFSEPSEHQSAMVDEALVNVHEILAENDESLLSAFIEGRAIPPDALKHRLISQAAEGLAFPLAFGSSLRGIGIDELMDAMITYLPEASQAVDSALSGVVFKIEQDKSHGKAAYVRLFAGSIRNRDSVENQTRAVVEKVNQIREIDGGHYRDTGLLSAGDVGALYGLGEAHVGDVLGTGAHFSNVHGLSVPLLNVQVIPVNAEDSQRLVFAMQELGLEDPTLAVEWHPLERELIISVMGTIQLEVLEQLVWDRFGIAIRFSEPSVIYKETPHQSAYGFVSYTMPKPCWAILRFLIEPAEPGSGLVYRANVRTEDLLQRYQNEVERRVPEALEQGLYGWHVTDLRVTLVEGQHHVWHTHPLDFVVATPMGIMDGLKNAGTDLLEPILSYRLSVPEEFGGRVLNDLAIMRGDYDNPVITNGRFTVEGTVPLATSISYAVELGMLTGGRAVFSSRYKEYRKCPPGTVATRTRLGVNPLDTARYILYARSALSSDS